MQVVEAEHPERRRPLQQDVQEVGGGQRVVEGAVGGPVVEPEPAGQRAEPAVAAPRRAAGGGPARTCRRSGGRAGASRSRSSAALRNADVEADVVADQDAPPTNSTNGGQHGLDAGRRRHHRLGDAGQHRDLGRDRRARVHQRLERAEALAAAHLHGADLGDAARRPPMPPVVSRSTTQNVTSRAACPGRRTSAARRHAIDEHMFVANTRSWHVVKRRPRRGPPVPCGHGGPLPLHVVRQPHPLRRGHHPADRAFHHYTAGGELVVEDEEVLRGVGRGRHVPLVRTRPARWSRSPAARRPGRRARPAGRRRRRAPAPGARAGLRRGRRRGAAATRRCRAAGAAAVPPVPEAARPRPRPGAQGRRRRRRVPPSGSPPSATEELAAGRAGCGSTARGLGGRAGGAGRRRRRDEAAAAEAPGRAGGRQAASTPPRRPPGEPPVRSPPAAGRAGGRSAERRDELEAGRSAGAQGRPARGRAGRRPAGASSRGRPSTRPVPVTRSPTGRAAAPATPEARPGRSRRQLAAAEARRRALAEAALELARARRRAPPAAPAVSRPPVGAPASALVVALRERGRRATQRLGRRAGGARRSAIEPAAAGGGPAVPAVAAAAAARRRGPARRRCGLPGGVFADTVQAAPTCVRQPGVMLVVDGYNVAKFGWPDQTCRCSGTGCSTPWTSWWPAHGTAVRRRLRRRRRTAPAGPPPAPLRVGVLAAPASRPTTSSSTSSTPSRRPAGGRGHQRPRGPRRRRAEAPT